MKGIHVPVSALEKAFTAWQEAAWKYIERAFGVLQCCFQIMARPLYAHSSLVKMRNTVSACLNMHNMCVWDSVMDGNVYAIYDPLHDYCDEQQAINIDMVAIGNENFEYHRQQQQDADPDCNTKVETERYCEEIQATIGLAFAGNEFVVQHMLAQQANWKVLNDRYEHGCLHAALKKLKGQA